MGLELEGLYSVEYFMKEGEPVIITFERLKNKKKRIKFYSGFYPYFYISQKEKGKLLLLMSDINTRDKIKNVERVDIKGFDGDELIKIVLYEPSQIYNIKNKFTKTYEADILFVNRFVIDKVDKIIPTEYYKLYFDIETTIKYGPPDYNNPVEKIISITLFDSYRNKYIVFYWSNKKIESLDIKENVDVEVRGFDKEVDMLNEFIDYIYKSKPDYLLAWNVLFDINYLVSRCEKLGIDVRRMSPLYDVRDKIFNLDLVKWYEGSLYKGKLFMKKDDEKWARIVGLRYFDLLQGYRYVAGKELKSYALDYVAKEELGKSKFMTHFDIDKLWKEDLKSFLKYNFYDVYLIKELDEKVGISKKFFDIQNITFLTNINDTLSSGRVLDNYILKEVKGKVALPSKSYDNKIDTSVAGGFVKQPKPGIYKNVAVFDFSSFYPSIIKTFNISPDSIKNIEVFFKNNSVEEGDMIDKEILSLPVQKNEDVVKYIIRTDKFKADVVIDLSKDGLITKIIDELIRIRKKIKDEMKKYKYGSLEYERLYKLQFSYKFLINAIYGVNAYPGFRLFNPDVANTITAFARMLSKFVSYYIQKEGWNWIYSDTDSVFIELKSESLEDNLKEMKQIQKVIDRAIDEFVKKYLPEKYLNRSMIKMSSEKIYSSIMFLGEKKRYAGYLKWFDGQVVDNMFHYMGIDFKKSNISEVERFAQERIIKALLNGENIQEVIEEIYSKIYNEKDIEKFFIPAKLEKSIEEYKVQNIPVIRAVKWSNKNLKTNFRQGSKFYIIYVSRGVGVDVIALENKKQLNGWNIVVDKKFYLGRVYKKLDIVLKNTNYSKTNYNVFTSYNQNDGISLTNCIW